MCSCVYQREEILSTFEQAFQELENQATVMVKKTSQLASLAKKFHKATQDGNIQLIRKFAVQLNEAIKSAEEEVGQPISPWPFKPEEEEEYLKKNYISELLGMAKRNDVKIFQDADRLIVFPSVLQILPSDKAVKIDRNKVATIRPSKMVSLLKEHQTKKPKFASERFLESMYKAYKLLVGKEGREVIALYKIYDALTLAPGVAQEYSKSDFARDLYLLDRSGLIQTRSGAKYIFSTSTGTRGSNPRNTYTFVSPEGEMVIYYGIRFMENSQ